MFHQARCATHRPVAVAPVSKRCQTVATPALAAVERTGVPATPPCCSPFCCGPPWLAAYASGRQSPRRAMQARFACAGTTRERCTVTAALPGVHARPHVEIVRAHERAMNGRQLSFNVHVGRRHRHHLFVPSRCGRRRLASVPDRLHSRPRPELPCARPAYTVISSAMGRWPAAGSLRRP